MKAQSPTSDSELNAILHELVSSAQSTLGSNFVSAYLQGSFALGDWDNDSDVDFTIVVEREISDTELKSLQTMHARIFKQESTWAQHLEGSYFPKSLLKSGDPLKIKIPYLDNASDKLIMSDHDNTLVVRWIVREHGITLAGSEPTELIDPVSADDLRSEVSATMREWAEEIFTGKWSMNNRWAQPFAALSYCRMLHTLETGRIASKLSGVQWSKDTLDKRWATLIQRAWDERPNPSLKVRQVADTNAVNDTLEFIRYAISSAAVSNL